ncbi:hypothetical protein GGR51DRAFT_562840 [Nemania sp. FL0031]|nr:hypothetical protein GGR51DRAFT_562840 [Nemania sp. FL0031]
MPRSVNMATDIIIPAIGTAIAVSVGYGAFRGPRDNYPIKSIGVFAAYNRARASLEEARLRALWAERQRGVTDGKRNRHN